jgi:saccharopine dehydrogenase (NAD+, L-lysine forming)
MKVGIIREQKVPVDKRVALNPNQCLEIKAAYPEIDLVVQRSDYRCFSDDEYHSYGITMVGDVSDCDLLIGIKEIPIASLLESKSYLIFSHTIKEQPHNKKMFRAMADKQITLVDYECLTDEAGNRLIGFGRFAGIVGAYNAILGFGKKHDRYDLKPANKCRDKSELLSELRRVNLPNIKIVVTGGGRVANGATEILGASNIKKVTPFELQNFSFREPVYAQLHSKDYHKPKDGGLWYSDEFYNHPEKFESTFQKFLPVTDILIHASYWNPDAPVLFSIDEMRSPSFRIDLIADITCDILGSIPSTFRSATIDKPFYGFNSTTECEDVPFRKGIVTVMAVDNLPCELPRDSSEAFGKHLIDRVLSSIFNNDQSGLIERATILSKGNLQEKYAYLYDYLNTI